LAGGGDQDLIIRSLNGEVVVERADQDEFLAAVELLLWKGKLRSIKTLYRKEHTLELWGIPQILAPGQHPRDLNRKHWVYLGSPGWWGSLSLAKRETIEEFLGQHKGRVPMNPEEFSELPV
jgi:hypothetical protein